MSLKINRKPIAIILAVFIAILSLIQDIQHIAAASPEGGVLMPLVTSNGWSGGYWDGNVAGDRGEIVVSGTPGQGAYFCFQTTDRHAVPGRESYCTIGFTMQRCKPGMMRYDDANTDNFVCIPLMDAAHSYTGAGGIVYTNQELGERQYVSRWYIPADSIIAAIEGAGYMEWAEELRDQTKVSYVKFDAVMSTRYSGNDSTINGTFTGAGIINRAAVTGHVWGATTIQNDFGPGFHSYNGGSAGVTPDLSIFSRSQIANHFNKYAMFPKIVETPIVPVVPESFVTDDEGLFVTYATENSDGITGKQLLSDSPTFWTYNDSRSYDDGKSHTYYNLHDGIPTSERLVNGLAASSCFGNVSIGLRKVTKNISFSYQYKLKEWVVPTATATNPNPTGSWNTLGPYTQTVTTTRSYFYYYLIDLNMYEFYGANTTNDAFPGSAGFKVQPYLQAELHKFLKDGDISLRSNEYRAWYNTKDGDKEAWYEVKNDGTTEDRRFPSSVTLGFDDDEKVVYGKTEGYRADLGMMPTVARKDSADDKKQIMSEVLTAINNSVPFIDWGGKVYIDGFRLNHKVIMPKKDITVTGVKPRYIDDTLAYTYDFTGTNVRFTGNKLYELYQDKNGTTQKITPGEFAGSPSGWKYPDYLSDCIPQWPFDNSYGSMDQKGFNLESFETTEQFGKSPITIPSDTANGEYRTAIDNPGTTADTDGVIYKRVLYDKVSDTFRRKYEEHSGPMYQFDAGFLEWSAGYSERMNPNPFADSMVLGVLVQSIDGNIMESSAAVTGHFMEGGNEPVVVKTPVIGPVNIYEGNNPDAVPNDDLLPDKSHGRGTQLIDEGEGGEVTYYLRLDSTYTFYFSLQQHLMAQGYGWAGDIDNGWDETDDKYDKYVKAKYVHFPFDVMMQGTFYDSVDDPNDDEYWIPIDDLSKTVFYIPTWADEGTYTDGGGSTGHGPIKYKVLAENVDDQYGENHEDEEHPRQNVDDSLSPDSDMYYVATYEIPVNLSGWLYDFSVVGVNDPLTFDALKGDKGSIWAALATRKNEKIQPFSRFYYNMLTTDVKGEKAVKWINSKQRRNAADGSLTNAAPYRQLPFSANTAENNKNPEGTLWMGTKLLYSVKSIANLYHDSDYVRITPKFRYITPKGDVIDNIDIYYDDSSISKYYVRMGSEDDKDNEEKTSFAEQGFNDSMYYLNQQYTIASGNNGASTRKFSKVTAEEISQLLNKHNGKFTRTSITIPSSLRLLSGTAQETGRPDVHYEDIGGSLHSRTGGDEGYGLPMALDDSIAGYMAGDNADTSNRKYFERLVEYSWVSRLKWDEEKGSHVPDDKYGGSELDIDSGEQENKLIKENYKLFRNSMQTWYGSYNIPSKMYVTTIKDESVIRNAIGTKNDKECDPEDKPANNGSGGIWLSSDGYLVLNFEIRTYRDGKEHLVYGSDNDGSDMWGIQAGLGSIRSSGNSFKPTDGEDMPKVTIGDKNDPDRSQISISQKRGDIAVIDLKHSLSDKYDAGLFMIN